MNRLFPLNELDRTGCFIGMDEAGYGPNLGPLVIASTSWQTPDHPDECDFSVLLQDAVDTESTCRQSRLHIADSKLVNKGKYGFASLETSALALLSAAGLELTNFRELRDFVCQNTQPEEDPLVSLPWFDDDLKLPVEADFKSVENLLSRFRSTLKRQFFGPLMIQAEIVPAIKFNKFLDEFGSKGVVLTTIAIDLLKRTWNHDSLRPTLFIGDKHGGRNHYSDYLKGISAEAIEIIQESQAVSRYRIDTSEFRFQTKGEQHLPVAAASIIAKYIRELAMIQFNTYWRQYCPDIKPTKGYPVDAKRFHEQIESAQKKLKISDFMLWRKR